MQLLTNFGIMPTCLCEWVFVPVCVRPACLCGCLCLCMCARDKPACVSGQHACECVRARGQPACVCGLPVCGQPTCVCVHAPSLPVCVCVRACGQPTWISVWHWFVTWLHLNTPLRSPSLAHIPASGATSGDKELYNSSSGNVSSVPDQYQLKYHPHTFHPKQPRCYP